MKRFSLLFVIFLGLTLTACGGGQKINGIPPLRLTVQSK